MEQESQALFGSLVVALDRCKLLMTVDSGEVFVDGDNVKPPDYLIVLRSGRRLLVDVKNIPPSRPQGPLRLSANELTGLQRFADLLGAEIFIAGLYSAMNEWVLLPAGAFQEDDRGRFMVDLQTAFKSNEMGSLGDQMLGIVPPLRLDVLPDATQPHEIGPDGQTQFTIGGVELHVGSHQMETDEERQLAMFLLQFSQWPSRTHADVEGSTLTRVSLLCEPEEPTPAQGFEIVGKLSSLYTRWFDAATRDEQGVSALQAPIQPGILPALVPADFHSPRLPLWRFIITPSNDEADPEQDIT